MTRPSALLPLAAAALVVMTTAGPRAASPAPVRAAHGMVGSSEIHASQAGVDILKAGGNAVDAAVATGFALAVTHPEAGNIGGGGFMVIRLASGKETTIDYREKAPGRATRDMFLDGQGNAVNERSRSGPLASGVPGSVAGLALAEREYGRLTLAQVMAPAIALARDGFIVSRSLADSLRRAQPRLAKFPASLKAFYKDDGSPLGEGDRLVQPDLARTLSLIATDGPDAFYRGAIADLLTREMNASNGLITKADLAAYQPAERAPVTGTYHGYRIVSMAPPSSGGVGLLELLNILEPYPLSEYGANAPRTMHLMIEAACMRTGRSGSAIRISSRCR
jgi:gamma-glutamyltranspeptidase/glutathione hydrolase